jgi:predicted transcriptional regulator
MQRPSSSKPVITPERCRQRREALGLTRDQLAAMAGLATRTLDSFEDGRVATRHTTLMALLRALRTAEAAARPLST